MITQETRLLEVTTPLGKDVLLLDSFSGTENMSSLYKYQLEMYSTEDWIAPQKIVGKKISWTVKLENGDKRHFSGFVSRFSAGERETAMRSYRAEVVPWLWFLTLNTDCKAYQEKTVPQILEETFKKHGFQDYETGELREQHPKWEYCVQYNESDFNFASRLMEQEGIFYFFRHDGDKHVMVLADSKGAYKNAPEHKLTYEYTHSSRMREDRLTAWDHQFEFTSGKWSQTDYYFEDPARAERTPSKILQTEQPSVVQLDGNKKYEVFYYPGEYEKKPEGDSDTKCRIGSVETRHDGIVGSSTYRTLGVGNKFSIEKHDCQSETGKSYVITSISHNASEPTRYGVAEGGLASADYRNSFTCIPDSTTYRPVRSTPKPLIHGIQSAVVVGPDGEEIWCDKHGRVKVQFFWDRYGKRDDKTSCWMRVTQPSAGKGWGTMSIPRIGQEVIVSFLEGDPDRPLITGLVYNPDQMVAYDLPKEKNKTLIKTNSTPGGEGFNEIRLDDTAGKEQFFVHAQYDLDQRILHDKREIVKNNVHTIIEGNLYEEVGKNQEVKIGSNYIVSVGKNVEEKVGGNYDFDLASNRTETVGGNEALTVAGSQTISVGGNDAFNVGKNRTETIGGNHSESIGKSHLEHVGKSSFTISGKHRVEVAQSNHIISAGKTVHVIGGAKVIIEAGQQITIKGPGGFVDIGPAGVTIQGMMVKINSGGAPGSGPGKPMVPGPPSKKDPKKAKKADPKKPTEADNSTSGQKSTPY
jgi:type VI secretion system secreted protein VgrG